MAKKFLTVNLETGKKQLQTAIVEGNYDGTKSEVAYSAESVDGFITDINGDIVLAEEFRVTGVNVGNFNDGTTIPAGTSVLELLQQMLQKQIPPTYSAPSAGITASNSGNVEAGTMVTPLVKSSYNKKDGGNVTKYVLKKNDQVIKDVDELEDFTETEAIQIGDGTTLKYSSVISYADGPIKNDNFGKPYPTGSIKAGSVNAGPVNFTGQRKRFSTTDNQSTIPTTSDEIRACKDSALNPSNGSTFSVVIPAGGTRAIFAYPATLRDVTSVKYVELGNGEVKDTFQKQIIKVEGANGFDAIDYKVYVYVSAVPAAGQMTYNVTI